MKKGKREQKYIGFLLGMLVTMLLSFGLICVMAQPADDTTIPNDTEAEVTQAVPAETTPLAETAATDIPTETAPVTTAPVPTAPATPATTKPATTSPAKKTPPRGTKVPTRSGVKETTVPPGTQTTVPPVTQVPVTGAPTITASLATLVPTLTPTPVKTEPPVTLGPIDAGASLPEYNPQITPGKPAINPEAPSEPAVDMHGYVLRIAAPWDEYQDTSLNTEAIAAFEIKYNCKVLFLDLSEETLYNRLLMSQATGTTYFDAILVEGTDILVNLVPLGVLQPFSQYMTEEELTDLPVSYQKFLSKDGVLYGIPAKAPDFAGLWYNPALETQYQYASSLNAYNSGRWEWNQFTTFLREATRDLDNDGFYNTYGLATSSPWYLSVLEATGSSMFRWNGSQFLPGATNAVSVQALSFVSNIYRNHYVASDYERYFYTGQAPYLAGELSMYSELKSYLKEKIFFMPYPSVNGLAPYKAVATSVPSAAIVSTAVYPEQTAELLKILYGGQALNQRIETYCQESGFSKEIQNVYLTMLESFTVDYTGAFDTTGEIQLTLVSLLKNREITAQTLNDSIEPLLETVIREKSTKVNLKEVPVEIRW